MKMILYCPKGNSPTCPACGNWNALLDLRANFYNHEKHDQDSIELLQCRDCGYTVTWESVTLKDPNPIIFK